MVFAYKVAGAAAQRGYDLEKLVSVTEKALDNIRTMGIALSPCIVPEVGKPTFSIKDDEMEIGMGIHGEVGIEVSKLKTSAEVAKMIFDKIATEISFSKNDEVAVMINGLGATPLEELSIQYFKWSGCKSNKPSCRGICNINGDGRAFYHNYEIG